MASNGGGQRSCARALLVLLLGIVLLWASALGAWAQTPPSPPSTEPSGPSQAPEQTQPQESQQPPKAQQPPTIEPQQLQPLPFQQQLLPTLPGQSPATPGTPPSTTLPLWTPPQPPPPSQSNIPAPVPFPAAGGLIPGAPGLTLPGAFPATVRTFRGGTLELHPTLHVSEAYSDNFFQTSIKTEENFRSIFGPGFLLLLNGARTFGTLSTTLDLAHDTAKGSGDEVKFFPSASAGVRYFIDPRLSLSFTDTYIRNDEPAAVDQFGLRRGRRTFDTNGFSTTVDWIIDRFVTQAYYKNSLFLNEGGNNQTANNQTAAGTGQSDTMTHILGVNGSTRFATDYTAKLGYEFSQTNTLTGTNADSTGHLVFGSFSKQFGLFTTAGLSSSYSHQTLNNTSIYNVSLFGAYGLPQGLSVSAAVGYSWLHNDTESDSGFSTNTAIAYRFARAIVSVGVFQDFRQSGQQGQNFGTVQSRSYFGSFLYQFTPFLNGTLLASYSENEPTGSGNTSSGGTQTTLTYGANLNWQVLRWLVASARYTYSKRTGNTAFGAVGTGDIAENQATLNLFATF